MKSEIKKELTKKRLDDEKRATLQSMILCLDGLEAYSSSLSKKAAEDAAAETDPVRRKELELLKSVCSQVVKKPARTLDEAGKCCLDNMDRSSHGKYERGAFARTA